MELDDAPQDGPAVPKALAQRVKSVIAKRPPSVPGQGQHSEQDFSDKFVKLCQFLRFFEVEGSSFRGLIFGTTELPLEAVVLEN